MTNQSKVLFLVEVAIFSAFAILLDELSGFLTGRFWPQGGSVSIGMLPVLIMAFRWGLKGGLLSGLLFGGLQILLGASIYHPVQGFIDYFFAFTLVGVAGIFAKQVKDGITNGNGTKWIIYVILGTILGGFLRFLCHFIAGIVFFASFAGDQNVVIYSLVYNGGYMTLSTLFCIILLILLIPALPKKYFFAMTART
ncbi:energy-coupled thiamine transporter ThiT [Salinibacillus xinjiangensis]|uniref:Energy-coupled thiamine transporter ThiT n=1 Tax=Salinibacillus xinjiangensis TaxID=1229268 RepID=A0A6G1X8E9_9BACI|nr:energy-coupled thiamine transporter ThiT [Salinibacillus xinjiangensis]MRG87281.1 energy-coupled thiamine transporter ThiT [Salinibacillus xinjiangensis]